MAARDASAAVITIHKNGVSPDLVKLAIEDLDIIRAAQQDGPSSINGPIGTEHWFFGIHKCARRMTNDKALEGNELNWVIGGSLNLNQVPKAHDLDNGLVKIHSLFRPII